MNAHNIVFHSGVLRAAFRSTKREKKNVETLLLKGISILRNVRAQSSISKRLDESLKIKCTT